MFFSSVLILLYVRIRPILTSLERIDAVHPHFFLHAIAVCGAVECINKALDSIKLKRNEDKVKQEEEKDESKDEEEDGKSVVPLPGNRSSARKRKKSSAPKPIPKPASIGDKLIELVTISIAFSMAVCSYVVLVANFCMPAAIVWNFVTFLKNIYSALLLLCYILYRTYRIALWWLYQPEPSKPKPKPKPKFITEIVAWANKLYDMYLRDYPLPEAARI